MHMHMNLIPGSPSSLKSPVQMLGSLDVWEESRTRAKGARAGGRSLVRYWRRELIMLSIYSTDGGLPLGAYLEAILPIHLSIYLSTT